MGMAKLDQHDAFRLRRTFGDMDDFRYYTTTVEGWTSVLNGSATIAAGDGNCGILTMSAIDSTNNRELYLKQTNKLFTFAAGKPISIEARLQFTEANTNAANVAFGVASSVANGLIVDDGAGMATSGSFASIFKVDGGTVWKTASSVGSTQNISTSTTTAGGASYQTVRIDIEPVSATIAEITYYVNDIQLLTSGGRPGQSMIKDQLTYTGAAAMTLFAGLKNGSTSAEVLLIDYIAWEFLR